MTKTYQCPDCDGIVEVGYDEIWSCNMCNTWFSEIPGWLEYYEGEVSE